MRQVRATLTLRNPAAKGCLPDEAYRRAGLLRGRLARFFSRREVTLTDYLCGGQIVRFGIEPPRDSGFEDKYIRMVEVGATLFVRVLSGKTSEVACVARNRV